MEVKWPALVDQMSQEQAELESRSLEIEQRCQQLHDVKRIILQEIAEMTEEESERARREQSWLTQKNM
jgi:hypothetical protein